MSIRMIIVMILIGIFTGIVTGLTGASGVIVVVPFLNIFLNFPIHESIGTSLMVNIISPLAISYIYYKHGNIDIKSGIWIALGTIIGAQVGTTFAFSISEGGLSGGFGVLMIIMGVVIWNKGLNHTSITKTPNKETKFETKTQRIITALILGFFVGIMTGIFGAGGGGLILLILIFVLNFPIHLAIGTSAFLMVIAACSGTIGYALHGNVQTVAGLIIGISAAGSGVASAVFANRVNEQVLSKAVGIIFIILGILMTILNFYK